MGRGLRLSEGKPSCLISGEGELAGIGAFKGPAGLADLLIQTQRLDQCGVTQLFRFTVGRTERAADETLVRALVERFRGSKHAFTDLLLDLVALPGFRHRVIDDTSR